MTNQEIKAIYYFPQDQDYKKARSYWLFALELFLKEQGFKESRFFNRNYKSIMWWKSPKFPKVGFWDRSDSDSFEGPSSKNMYLFSVEKKNIVTHENGTKLLNWAPSNGGTWYYEFQYNEFSFDRAFKIKGGWYNFADGLAILRKAMASIQSKDFE